MMWLLDTNAIITYLGRFKGDELSLLSQIYTTILNVIEHPPATKWETLVVLQPNSDNYTHSVDYAIKLRMKGTPIPAIDIVIGAIAVERSFCVVTNDSHFDSFQKIEPNLKICSVEDCLKKLKP